MPHGEKQLTGGARKRRAKEEKMKEESKPPHAKSVYGAPAQKNPHPLKFTKDAHPAARLLSRDVGEASESVIIGV
jgi:hypothetical protein